MTSSGRSAAVLDRRFEEAREAAELSGVGRAFSDYAVGWVMWLGAVVMLLMGSRRSIAVDIIRAR
jgi:hypothetical protein